MVATNDTLISLQVNDLVALDAASEAHLSWDQTRRSGLINAIVAAHSPPCIRHFT